MSQSTPLLSRWFHTFLWGASVSLSWMWGLGLFFSVQFTAEFGLSGLLSFAIPNGLGLIFFGFVTHHIARRAKGGESLANFFSRWSRPFRLAFFLYQLLALTLTMFALLRYGWMPLGLEPEFLFLPLTLLVALCAAFLFGEEFNIRRIKYSHGVMFFILCAAIATILYGITNNSFSAVAPPAIAPKNWNFVGHLIPIFIGFIAGPWMDLQQWQRAIQMHRERISVAAGYLIGGSLFFMLLLFHGLLTLWGLSHGAAGFLQKGVADHLIAHDILTRFFYLHSSAFPWIFGAYAVFLCICLLSTLDSGYIAFRWFLQSHVRASNHPIFALIPSWLVTSPIPIFIVGGMVALIGAALGLQLEYFMIFYATFFVGYASLGIVRAFMNSPANAIPQVKMFSIGSIAVVTFSYGYFLHEPAFLIIGSLLPLCYIIWLILKPTSSEEFTSDGDSLDQPSSSPAPSLTVKQEEPASFPHELSTITATIAAAANAMGSPGGHFEGKWFVHTFVATYADTNSVGNVYFGMYAMWVGKTRELFFNKVMPKFNLQDTPFYILTRAFEHKFIRETREFETVSVRIRVASYNRKLATLEHEIYDSKSTLLGKGKQTLIFVSSTDYHILDVPADVYNAFLPLVGS